MLRKTFAIYSLVVGALVGVIGDLLFYNRLIGVSFPLFMLIAILMVVASNGILRQPLRLRNLWVLIPAMFFACMVAVRADQQLGALNVIAALLLSALALTYLPLSRRIDLDSTADHLLRVMDGFTGAVLDPFYEIFDSISWFFERLEGNWRVVASVGRGLVISAPVLLIFGLLLASADAVFAGYFRQIVGWFRLPNLSLSTVSQLVFIGMVGWLSCGGVAYGVARRERFQHAEREDKPKRKLPAIGMIEGTITLASVDLLFAAFVVIQFAYFFGGRDTVLAQGLTYADYARRGFFELVAVSVLTLGLVLALDSMTVRRRQQHTRLFQALAVALVALTGVILVSASQRMLLYEQQYGFTMLRVYTHVFMYWLAALFGVFLLALFRLRPRIFSVGLLLVLIGYLGTLNLMNVDQYIAERNLDRAGQEVDFYYLSFLSADAEPTLLALYQTTDSPSLRAASGQWLAALLYRLDRARQTNGSTILSANLSREAAWASLDSVRDTLPEYQQLYFYRHSTVREDG